MAEKVLYACLNLAAGVTGTYTLTNIPGKPDCTLSEENPACPHALPEGYIRTAKLHKDKYQIHQKRGRAARSVPRFLFRATPWPVVAAPVVDDAPIVVEGDDEIPLESDGADAATDASASTATPPASRGARSGARKPSDP